MSEDAGHSAARCLDRRHTMAHCLEHGLPLLNPFWSQAAFGAVAKEFESLWLSDGKKTVGSLGQ